MVVDDDDADMQALSTTSVSISLMDLVKVMGKKMCC